MTTDSASTEPAIELLDLRKVYAGAAKPALSSASLVVPTGAIFGLLGPNGAGKSTLINILAGLVRKSGGQARICGIDASARAARCLIGVVPQDLVLDPYFTPRAALELQAGLFGIPRRAHRTDELLQALGLISVAERPARSLSGGMRRRLMVAKALVHDPQVLILDEPTAGVDVELRRQLWDYVRRLNSLGKTVLLTTHYLHEAEELCDQIALLVDGQIAIHESTEALLRRVKDKALEVELCAPLDTIPTELKPFDVVLNSPQQLVLRYGHEDGTVGQFLTALHRSELPVKDIRTIRPSLEEVFLRLSKERTDALMAGGIDRSKQR